MTHYYIILQLIKSLQAEVTLLESELVAQNVQVQTTTPIVFPVASTTWTSTETPAIEPTSTHQVETITPTLGDVPVLTSVPMSTFGSYDIQYSCEDQRQIQGVQSMGLYFIAPEWVSGNGVQESITLNGQTYDFPPTAEFGMDLTNDVAIGTMYEYDVHVQDATNEADATGTFTTSPTFPIYTETSSCEQSLLQ